MLSRVRVVLAKVNNLPKLINILSFLVFLGVTARAAQNECRLKIKRENPDNWDEIFADRSKLPSIFWIHARFRKLMDREYGSSDGVDAFKKAEELVKKFDNECKQENPLPENEHYAKIIQTADGETIVAVVDPFMRRVHSTVPQSGEIVMVDATSNLDRGDSKVFHFICPSTIGGLPLAELIITREDAATILSGLELLKSILPTFAFYGRGADIGPVCVMTDDCDAERKALASAWSTAILLLCLFHILQVCLYLLNLSQNLTYGYFYILCCTHMSSRGCPLILLIHY